MRASPEALDSGTPAPRAVGSERLRDSEARRGSRIARCEPLRRSALPCAVRHGQLLPDVRAAPRRARLQAEAPRSRNRGRNQPTGVASGISGHRVGDLGAGARELVPRRSRRAEARGHVESIRVERAASVEILPTRDGRRKGASPPKAPPARARPHPAAPRPTSPGGRGHRNAFAPRHGPRPRFLRGGRRRELMVPRKPQLG